MQYNLEARSFSFKEFWKAFMLFLSITRLHKRRSRMMLLMKKLRQTALEPHIILMSNNLGIGKNKVSLNILLLQIVTWTERLRIIFTSTTCMGPAFTCTKVTFGCGLLVTEKFIFTHGNGIGVVLNVGTWLLVFVCSDLLFDVLFLENNVACHSFRHTINLLREYIILQSPKLST